VSKSAGPRFLALSSVAVLRMRLGDHRPAERMLRLCVHLNYRYGQQSIVAEARAALGVLHLREGRPTEAVDELRQALVLADDIGEHLLSSLFGTDLGKALLALGDRAGAVAAFRRAAERGRTGEGPYEEAGALAALAGAIAADDPAAARRHAERALATYRAMNIGEQHQIEKWLADGMSGSI